MRRLFTFGCSFTNYRWSTWADALAPEFDYFENWGQSGAGNHFIFNSVMECDQRHCFGSHDTVVICWSDIMREDRYTDRWQTLGVVANNSLYSKQYVASMTTRGQLIRDLALIKATRAFLKSKRTPFKWRFLAICPITKEHLWADDTVTDASDVIELYQDIIKSILPSYREVLRPLGWGGDSAEWVNSRNGDSHPNPMEHLQYLDTVLPGWVTKEETRVKMQEETLLLEQNKYNLQNHRPRRSGLSTVQRL
jgi:hypothetical protein